MKKIAALLAFAGSIGVVTPCILRPSFTLHQILDHYQYYKLIHSNFHAGHLLQHSLWACRSLAQWFDEDKFWVEQLKPIQHLMILSGLLHDVGKAGDHNFYYTHKKPHPIAGAGYVMKKRPFWLLGGRPLYLKNLFRELEVSGEEQKMLAIFIAMHMELGNGILKRVQQDGIAVIDDACNAYLTKLYKHCKEFNFNNGIPTMQLLHGALAISAADVRAIQPNTYVNDLLVSFLSPRIAHRYMTRRSRGFDAYDKFAFDTQGRMARDHVCKMLEKELEK